MPDNSDESPSPSPESPDESTSPEKSDSSCRGIRCYLSPTHFVGQTVRDVLITLAFLSIIAAILLMYTGLWPPFVSVISGSMEPELERGDLVLIMEPERATAPDHIIHNDIVTYESGEAHGYTSLGDYGDVIIFSPNNGSHYGEIIHRAMFHVEEGENWHARANPEYISAANCESLSHCPAPHDGFITKGDANRQYDQASGISGPVPRSDIRGVASHDVPYLGYVRLVLSGE